MNAYDLWVQVVLKSNRIKFDQDKTDFELKADRSIVALTGDNGRFGFEIAEPARRWIDDNCIEPVLLRFDEPSGHLMVSFASEDDLILFKLKFA
jgi:hypothetical protein